MDISGNKPVTGVPSAAQATGKHPVLAIAASVPDPVQPVAPVAEIRPTAQNLVQTQQAIAEQVSRYLHSSTRNLEFQVDSDSGTAIIVVRDADGNVIRRIPGEEAMQLMQ